MNFEIRPTAPEDAKGINALRRMPGVFENTLGIPSEPVKKTENFIADFDSHIHQFVAVVQGADGEKVIGNVGLSVYTNPRTAHSGGIGIMVHKEYQNQGVGKALMDTILDIADNWLMLVRVDLTAFADNHRAIHLYEKCGFVAEGVKRMAAVRNGKYEDELMMARICTKSMSALENPKL